MKSKYFNLVWGLVLIAAGGLFLAQNGGLISEPSPQVWMVLLAGLSVLFFASYAINGIQQWGWLFPACISGALALVIGLNEAGIDHAAIGALIPASIAVPFIVIFALNTRKNWWGLIPAWVMLVVTAVILLTEWLSGDAMAVFIMLGFAVPFLVVYLTDRRRWWALIPFGVFCLNAMFVLLALRVPGVDLGRLWPVLPIIAGIMLLVTSLRPRKTG